MLRAPDTNRWAKHVCKSSDSTLFIGTVWFIHLWHVALNFKSFPVTFVSAIKVSSNRITTEIHIVRKEKVGLWAYLAQRQEALLEFNTTLQHGGALTVIHHLQDVYHVYLRTVSVDRNQKSKRSVSLFCSGAINLQKSVTPPASITHSSSSVMHNNSAMCCFFYTYLFVSTPVWLVRLNWAPSPKSKGSHPFSRRHVTVIRADTISIICWIPNNESQSQVNNVTFTYCDSYTGKNCWLVCSNRTQFFRVTCHRIQFGTAYTCVLQEFIKKLTCSMQKLQHLEGSHGSEQTETGSGAAAPGVEPPPLGCWWDLIGVGQWILIVFFVWLQLLQGHSASGISYCWNIKGGCRTVRL